MPRYVAFLRAINVGGRNVTMQALRQCFEELGLARVETFIASGNVIFESRSTQVKTLQARIEKQLLKSLGYEVSTFLRTDAQVAAIAVYQPFAEPLLSAAQALNVAFLDGELTPEERRQVKGFTSDLDEFHVQGAEVYWLCRKKQSESKFSNVVFERVLKRRATFRGVSTIKKLAAKYPAA